MQIFIHVMTSGMTSQEIWMFATGELGNQSNQMFCDLTGFTIYFSECKQTLVRFHLRSYENEKRYDVAHGIEQLDVTQKKRQTNILG